MIQNKTTYNTSQITKNNSENYILIYTKEGIFYVDFEKINLTNTGLTALTASKKYIAISGNDCCVTVLKLFKNIKNNQKIKEEQI